MQTISVQTTQNVSIQYPVASLGDRIVAYLLDRIILVVYVVAVAASFINADIEAWWVYVVFLVFPWFFYHLLFEIFMNGQSPGKRVMNIQVVRLDGTEPTIGDYIFRWMFSLVDFYILSGALAVIVIAVSGKGQRIGDMVAGTSVVKLIQQKEITADEIFIAPADTYVPVYAQVTQLQSRDIELIQRALDANREHGNIQPVLMVADKIKMLLGIQTDAPPVDFLYTLVNDYNQLTSR